MAYPRRVEGLRRRVADSGTPRSEEVGDAWTSARLVDQEPEAVRGAPGRGHEQGEGGAHLERVEEGGQAHGRQPRWTGRRLRGPDQGRAAREGPSRRHRG